MIEVTQAPWHYTNFWDWLDHWQTLIAGVLAFVAGVGTVWVAIWAILATRAIARAQIAASRADADSMIAATRAQTETTRAIATEQIAASREDANRVIAATRDQTETTVRLERMRDDAKSLAAALELQSAVGRYRSAIVDRRRQEIWPTYTEAWNYHTRFNSAYQVAAMGRWESLSNPPDEIAKLLDPRLKEVGKSVDQGEAPDQNKLKNIEDDLSKIVDGLRDRIADARP